MSKMMHIFGTMCHVSWGTIGHHEVHGALWGNMAYHGVPWGTIGYRYHVPCTMYKVACNLLRVCYEFVCSMVPWGRPGSLGYHGVPWGAMGYHGAPRGTMGYHGAPWGTMGYYWVPMVRSCDEVATKLYQAKMPSPWGKKLPVVST